LTPAEVVQSGIVKDEAVAIEDDFIIKLRENIEKHLDNTDFGIPQLCKAIGMSRSQLHKKIRSRL